jgi:hypothetical protein
MHSPLIASKNDLKKFKQLHFLNFNEYSPTIEDRIISEESLIDLELWWIRYDITKCFSENPIDISKLLYLHWDMPSGYVLGKDIQEALIKEINKLPEPHRREWWLLR